MPIDYSRLDEKYTKYLRNRAQRGQIGSTTETLNEIFPQAAPPSTMTAIQEAWLAYGKLIGSQNDAIITGISASPEKKKPSNVMPETKKRAITLEDA